MIYDFPPQCKRDNSFVGIYSTFECLRIPQVHVKVKSTKHSYHGKYIILEAKHGHFIIVVRKQILEITKWFY